MADLLSSAHVASLSALPLRGSVTSLGSPVALRLFGDAATKGLFIVAAAVTPRRQLSVGDFIRVHAETTVVFEARSQVHPRSRPPPPIQPVVSVESALTHVLPRSLHPFQPCRNGLKRPRRLRRDTRPSLARA